MGRLNYSHLRYFWAVAREGNLTRAAQKLHISQSALSIQIRKLEEQLRQKLFDRVGKKLDLTEAGRIVLDYADSIFRIGDELVSTLSAAEGRPRQVLRVGALATLSRNFQMGFLRPLLHRRDVEIVLRSGSLLELLQGLEAHRLDVVLVTQPPMRDAATPWISQPIAEQAVSLIGTPKRLKKYADFGVVPRAHGSGRKPLRAAGGTARGRNERLLSQLLGEPLILPTLESAIRSSFDALTQRLAVRPRIVAEVDDMAMLRLLAREDLGLAVIPPIVVKDELESGLLIEAQRLEGISETFFAVTLARRFAHPLLRDLFSE